jgi:cyclase
MIKKRIIGTIIIKDNLAVQSIGYNCYLPLGKPEILIENLDRWGADEIVILSIDRTLNNLGPNLNLFEKIKNISISTPLVYGGGIRNSKDAIEVIKLGADRILIDQLLISNPNEIEKMAGFLGAQAIVASIPILYSNINLFWYDYIQKKELPFSDFPAYLFNKKYISECLTIDCVGEGHFSAFNIEIVKSFPFKNIPLIPFGGVSEIAQMNELLAFQSVAGIAIGNFLSYKEISIQRIKESLIKHPIRIPQYEEKFSFYAN